MWLWRFPVQIRIFTLLNWQLQATSNYKNLHQKTFLVLKIISILQTHFIIFRTNLSNTGTLHRLLNLIRNSQSLVNRYLPTKVTRHNRELFKNRLNNPKIIVTTNKSIFNSFMKLNSWIKNKNLKVHHTFTNYYFYDNSSNLGIFNLKGVFNLWLNITNFFKNVVFYKKSYILFGNAYFKYEVLSLNHILNINFFTWRYAHLLIFFIDNKITLFMENYLYYLMGKGVRLAFVFDIFYHKRTIHILKKMKFVLLGPIPVTANLYTLDIALPVSSNSIFSNLFFIRLILFFKREVVKFNWLNLPNL